MIFRYVMLNFVRSKAFRMHFFIYPFNLLKAQQFNMKRGGGSRL